MRIELNPLGLIKFPADKISWADHSLLQPTPILIDEETIRVFCGMRDERGIGKIGYIDLSAKNPIEVLDISTEPVLESGEDGRFDDNGVIPCAVIKVDGVYRIYYAGYQPGNKVRFIAFSGLAMSEDGKNFKRYKQTPILERTDEAPLFRVIHSMVEEDDGWLIWYGGGDRFQQGKSKTLPVYNIRHMYSKDGLHFPERGELAVDIAGDEYRIGRPFVVKTEKNYIMFYGYGSEKHPYKLGMAISSDAKNWIRQDQSLIINGDIKAWENEMRAYPSVIRTKFGNYFFYNGNQYGYDGFACCKIEGLD